MCLTKPLTSRYFLYIIMLASCMHAVFTCSSHNLSHFPATFIVYQHNFSSATDTHSQKLNITNFQYENNTVDCYLSTLVHGTSAMILGKV